jgi:uncharacterized Zn finger protein/DNA-binding XRE family transcriptional regulator
MPWYGGFREYVPVAERRAKARRQMDRLRKQGQTIEPVEIEGRTIARSFWGKGWCDHLESFSDFSNRLPRGRTYARNGSVCHLGIKPGFIEARVAGSRLYQVTIGISSLDTRSWGKIKRRCAGQIGSMLELLQGKLSDRVMAVVADRQSGLFPKPGQISLDCSCPDWAAMCKHVAAVLYGVGNRLDTQPELLFTLRGVDPQELIAADLDLPAHAETGARTLADDQLADVFGIELEDSSPPDTAGSTNDASTRPTGKSGTRSAGKHQSRATNRKRTNAQAKPRSRAEDARGKSSRAGKAATASATTKRSTSRTSSETARRNGRPALRPTGKSVARLRRRTGLTRVQFARQLDVSPASVARWESAAGRLKLQQRCLNALADLKHDLDGR